MKGRTKHIITWSAMAIIGIAIVLWIDNRWSVWFYNVPEREYEAPTVPSRILLTYGNEGEWSRNISWQYERIVPSWAEVVEKGSTDTIKIEAKGEEWCSRAGRSCYYVACLRGVKPATRYRYRVHNAEEKSEWMEFGTQKEEGEIDFIYIGDVQDTLGRVKNREFKQMLRKHPETEMIVFGGDWAERPCDNYWGEAFNSIDSIGQAMPIMAVAGNHEYIKHLPLYVEMRYALTFSYFMKSMEGDNHVYTLRRGDVQFYFLDSNREFPHLLSQRKWLRKQMEESTAKWNILVLHHPIYSIRGAFTNLFVRMAFGSLAKRCDLILQGHEHNYARMCTKERSGRKTTPISIVSHWSPKNYRLYRNSHYDVFGEKMPTYQCIHIDADTLAITSYNANSNEMNDCVKVIKKGEKKEVVE